MAFCFVSGFVLLVLACFAYGQPRAGDRVARWHQSIPGLDESPDRFYAQVFQAVKEGLDMGEVPLVGMGFGPSRLFESRTIFSHRPLYFCARYKHLSYFLYVSHTPAGCFVSTWTYSKYLRGEEKPSLRNLAAHRYFLRQTLFQFDAALMFQESLHAIVLDVLDRYIEQHGLKPLEEYERRPVYHAFYNTAFPQLATQQFVTQSIAPQQVMPQPTTSQAPMPQAAMPQSAAAPNAIHPLVPQGVPANGDFYAAVHSSQASPYQDSRLDLIGSLHGDSSTNDSSTSHANALNANPFAVSRSENLYDESNHASGVAEDEDEGEDEGNNASKHNSDSTGNATGNAGDNEKDGEGIGLS